MSSSSVAQKMWKQALKQAIASGDRDAVTRLINNHFPVTSAPVITSSEALISNEENDGFAFAFDIDGVLIHNKDNIDYATETIHHLIDNSIPFIFLTNSGGETEAKRTEGLNKRFATTALSEDQFVQSHTPFRDLVPEYKDKTVLVIGGGADGARSVALDYGFKSVITTSDIIQAHPPLWPFLEQSREFHRKMAKPLPKPINPSDPANSLQVSLILVFSSPRDWGFDAQLCLDLLHSDSGVLGTKSPLNGKINYPNHGYQQQSDSCKIMFSNPDFVWKTDCEHGPRFGQGAFITAFEAIFREATDNKAYLLSERVGKPHRASYLYAEDVLLRKRGIMQGTSLPNAFKNVYMIGDNPLSDIKGANDFRSLRGSKWESILVETGVHEKGSVPKVKPSIVVIDVFDAVNWALRKEGKTEMIRAEIALSANGSALNETLG